MRDPVTSAGPRYDARRRQRGRRRLRNLVIAVVVVLALLVGADFAARAEAENVLAGKIQQQGLPRRPDVTIEGFPFLTQAAGKEFRQVNLSAADLPEGPVTITSLHATATNIRVNSYSFSSGTIQRVSGTALISYSSLAVTLTRQIGELGTLLRGAGLRLGPAGSDEVRASLNLIVTSGSATWRVALLPGQVLNIRLVGSGGLPSSLLSSIQDVNLRIPKLPLGLTIGSVAVTQAGVVGTIGASQVPFGS
jgi:LmeA-like phospholipid-binding